MSDFTEADVESATDALHDAHDTTYHVHAAECCVETDKYARAVLTAVVPAMRDRWLGELIAEVNAKRLELQARERPEYAEAVSCLASTERWLLRSKRSGGDQ